MKWINISKILPIAEALMLRTGVHAIRYRNVRFTQLHNFPYAIHHLIDETSFTVNIIAVVHTATDPACLPENSLTLRFQKPQTICRGKVTLNKKYKHERLVHTQPVIPVFHYYLLSLCFDYY